MDYYKEANFETRKFADRKQPYREGIDKILGVSYSSRRFQTIETADKMAHIRMAQVFDSLMATNV
jgi:hypothetical protein